MRRRLRADDLGDRLHAIQLQEIGMQNDPNAREPVVDRGTKGRWDADVVLPRVRKAIQARDRPRQGLDPWAGLGLQLHRLSPVQIARRYAHSLRDGAGAVHIASEPDHHAKTHARKLPARDEQGCGGRHLGHDDMQQRHVRGSNGKLPQDEQEDRPPHTTSGSENTWR
jgi:hypothetical protein